MYGWKFIDLALYKMNLWGKVCNWIWLVVPYFLLKNGLDIECLKVEIMKF